MTDETDNDEAETETNQARIVMETGNSNGFDGGTARVVVEGGEGETVEDIDDVAKERFEQANDAATIKESEHQQYQ